MPDNEFRKPYIAEIYRTLPQKRLFVYPREALMREPVFPYYVLDGGAFLFAGSRFGAQDSDTLLRDTFSGKVFDPIRTADGTLDWGASYHTTEKAGMPKRHEWQSWYQRLYMLLPLAQEYMRTGDKKYSDKWLEIVHAWKSASPYEPADMSTSHVNTSMKWRDMQVSWRTMSLLHSMYMLGTGDPFDKETWRELYEFIDLHFSHLVHEGDFDRDKKRLGNHTLQMASALVSGGILFAELPRAQEYFEYGMRILTACAKANVLPDGGTRETGPSYNHFIARLYLEACKHCELNGYPCRDGLHESVVRQYQWLASVADKQGKTLPLSDAYVMDARRDIRNMAEIFPFTCDFEKSSVWTRDSGYILLRSGLWEIVIDAAPVFGGHQHAGRAQILARYNGEELLTDTGCFDYDCGDLYVWCMTQEAHSVVELPSAPVDVQVLQCDLAENTVTVQIASKESTWTRSVALSGNTLTVSDSMTGDAPQRYTGRWYMPGRPTTLAQDPLRYTFSGNTARQMTSDGTAVLLNCSETLSLDAAPCMDAQNRCFYNERCTWTKEAQTFTVTTVLSVEQ